MTAINVRLIKFDSSKECTNTQIMQSTKRQNGGSFSREKKSYTLSYLIFLLLLDPVQRLCILCSQTGTARPERDGAPLSSTLQILNVIFNNRWEWLREFL